MPHYRGWDYLTNEWDHPNLPPLVLEQKRKYRGTTIWVSTVRQHRENLEEKKMWVTGLWALLDAIVVLYADTAFLYVLQNYDSFANVADGSLRALISDRRYFHLFGEKWTAVDINSLYFSAHWMIDIHCGFPYILTVRLCAPLNTEHLKIWLFLLTALHCCWVS